MEQASVAFGGDGRGAVSCLVWNHGAVDAAGADAVAGRQRGGVAGRRRDGARDAVGPGGGVRAGHGALLHGALLHGNPLHGAPLDGVRRRRRGHGLSSDELIGSLARDIVDPTTNERVQAPKHPKTEDIRRQEN